MTNQKARPLRYLSVGEGATIVLLHGYGMQPDTYLPLARLLADRAQIVIPAIFALPERWSSEHALDCLELTLDELGLEHVSLLGHSFGGGLELGLAERRADQITELVFSDTLGVHREFSLALEAVHPLGILRMASLPAMRAFFGSWLRHPVQLAAGAMWAFGSNRASAIDACVTAGIPCHVLWAQRDSILSRQDGKDFADRLHATFTVVDPPPGYGPVDHDWMFDDPELFAQHLERLDLKALPPRVE